jgi:hypothetical protein
MPEQPDLHQIDRELEGVEEYQSPPREHEQGTEADQISTGAGEHVDVSVLEAQQRRRDPEMSDPQRLPAEPKSTVSGKDELADPASPRATPPGERM